MRRFPVVRVGLAVAVQPALCAFVLAMLVAAPTAIFAQGPSVRASIEPATATVGDRLTLRIQVETPEGTDVEFPDVPAEVAPLVVLSSVVAAPRDENGMTVEDRYYIVAAFETGALGIPQLPFAYGTASGDSGVVWTDSLPIVIASVIPDTLAEEDSGPRDIKPPVALPRRVWPFIVAALAVGAALVGLHYLRKWWFGRKRKPREEKPIVPVVPKRAAHLVALKRLAALGDDDPAGRGDIVGFYVRVTEIVRFYIRDRFAVDAIDMTTAELAPSMERARIDADETIWAVRFLSHADLAKFAKHTPTVERAGDDLRDAREFVERTRFLEVGAEDEVEGDAPEPHDLAGTETSEDEAQGAEDDAERKANDGEVEP